MRRCCRPTSTLRKTVEAKDIEQLSFNGRNPIGVAGLKAGVIGGSFNNYGFSSLSNGGFNINGSRGDENNITVDGATAIRTRSSGAIDRRPERRRHPGSPGPDGQLHAGVRARQRRPDPHGDQERQQPLQRQRARTSSRRHRCRPTPGPATAATNAHREQSGRRRSTTSSTATRSAVRSPANVQEQAVLLRRAGVGQLLRRPDQQRHGADEADAAAATSASCSNPNNGFFNGARTSSIRRPASRSRATSSRPTACRPTAWRILNTYPAADARLPPGLGQPDPDRARTRRISARTTSASTTG